MFETVGEITNFYFAQTFTLHKVTEHNRKGMKASDTDRYIAVFN